MSNDIKTTEPGTFLPDASGDLTKTIDSAIALRNHASSHELAVIRGEILVRVLTQDVMATSAIEGILLDERAVMAKVFQELCRRGVL